MDYNFKIKRHKDLDFQAVVLADDTHIVLGNKKVTIMYPKKKFNKIFKEQMNDKKRKYIGVSFDNNELKTINKGLEKLTLE